jgi:hypothetical protein
MQRHRVSAAAMPVEEDAVDEQEEEEEEEKEEERLLGHNEHNVAANCYLATPGVIAQLIEQQNMGLVFGFASDMNGVCAIPDETYEHMLAVLAVVHAEVLCCIFALSLFPALTLSSLARTTSRTSSRTAASSSRASRSAARRSTRGCTRGTAAAAAASAPSRLVADFCVPLLCAAVTFLFATCNRTSST